MRCVRRFAKQRRIERPALSRPLSHCPVWPGDQAVAFIARMSRASAHRKADPSCPRASAGIDQRRYRGAQARRGDCHPQRRAGCREREGVIPFPYQIDLAM
jgi:hypothetical protein